MMWPLSMEGSSLRIAAVWLLFSALTGCGTISEFFAADSYEAPPAELVEFDAEIEPKVIWSSSTGDGANSNYANLAPKLLGDAIISVDYRGDVRSHNVENGRRGWRTKLSIPVATGVGGGDGLVVIGAQSGEVIALDETNGKELWRQRLSSEVLAPAQVGGNAVLVRTADGRLTALSANNGNILWNYQRSVPL